MIYVVEIKYCKPAFASIEAGAGKSGGHGTPFESRPIINFLKFDNPMSLDWALYFWRYSNAFDDIIESVKPALKRYEENKE
jgi:hypothetical protein